MLKANPDLSKKAKFYFISVDPERDSSQALQEYLNHFDNRIIGLTGDRIDIERTRKAFQAEAKTIRLPNKDYTVDHSVFIYILDKQNKIIAVYPSGTSGEILSKEIGTQSILQDKNLMVRMPAYEIFKNHVENYELSNPAAATQSVEGQSESWTPIDLMERNMEVPS
jgi:pyrroline-5-carboxylate reductase